MKRKIRKAIKDPIERIFLTTKVDVNGCWVWLGGVNRKNYGSTSIYGKTHTVHRIIKWSDTL